MRIIAKFEKQDQVRFISHLDVMRVFQRAFRRADIPIAYSQGFNPHQQLAFATALSLGYASSAEWLDAKLEREMSASDFCTLVNAQLPEGFFIKKAFCVEDSFKSLSSMMKAASYKVELPVDTDVSLLESAVNQLLSGEIVVYKKTKAGMKYVDMRPMLYDLKAVCDHDVISLDILGCLDASGSLNVDLLLGRLNELISLGAYRVFRQEIFADTDSSGEYMPAMSNGGDVL